MKNTVSDSPIIFLCNTDVQKLLAAWKIDGMHTEEGLKEELTAVGAVTSKVS